MSSSAIFLMIFAIVLVWGGLVLNVFMLRYRKVPEGVLADARAPLELSLGVNPASIRLVVFDLDDTLAPSKSPMEKPMAQAISHLLDEVEVCVISGGSFPQFETQFLASLHVADKQKDRLHFMPTCGTRYLRFVEGELKQQYARQLPASDRKNAAESLRERAKELDLWVEEPWGEIIEDRGTQVTFSALGQEAPLEVKRNWDPTGEKKDKLRAAVAKDLPELEVRSGGSTSVDVTKKGIDKGYGIRELMRETGFNASQIFFVGDRLDPEGNDYPVVGTGVTCYEVSSWQDTVEVINQFLAERQ